MTGSSSRYANCAKNDMLNENKPKTYNYLVFEQHNPGDRQENYPAWRQDGHTRQGMRVSKKLTINHVNSTNTPSKNPAGIVTQCVQDKNGGFGSSGNDGDSSNGGGKDKQRTVATEESGVTITKVTRVISEIKTVCRTKTRRTHAEDGNDGGDRGNQGW